MPVRKGCFSNAWGVHAEPAVGDWMIAEADGKKRMCQVLSLEKGEPKVVLEYGRWREDLRSETWVDREDVIAVLGDDPPEDVGMAGVRTFRYRKSYKTALGRLHLLKESDKDELKALKRAFRKTSETMERLELTGLFPVEWHLARNTGKPVGECRVRKDDMDLIRLMPREDMDLGFADILVHEIFHSVWSRALDDDFRARWIEAYHDKMDVSILDDGTMEAALDGMLAAGPKWKPEDDDLADALADGRDHLKRKHRIGPKDIAALLDAGRGDLVRSMWPESGHSARRRPSVSDYADVKAEEFFCEAFRIRLTIGQTPKSLERLARSTEAFIRGFEKEAA